MKDNSDDFWFFVSDDVLYVSMNIDPEDIIEGISAGDYFQGGVASEGFMGGAAGPEVLESLIFLAAVIG